MLAFLLLPLYAVNSHETGYYKGLDRGWFDVTGEGQRRYPSSRLSAVFYSAGFRRGRDEGAAAAYRGSRKWWE